MLKRRLRRAFREAKLEGRARLAFSDCLGPCSEANVVFVYHDGRSVLPEPRAARAFAWTGGGPGPEPPLPDA